MEKSELLKIIRANLREGKLHCKQAYEIAECHKIELKEIGRICNEENIKITGCQLGCF